MRVGVLVLLSLLVAGVFTTKPPPSPVPPTVSIQWGVNANLTSSPVFYGTANHIVLAGFNTSEIAVMQAWAEKTLLEDYNISFPAGPTPKTNSNGFKLEALSVSIPYTVWSIVDSTNSLPAFKPLSAKEKDQVPVVMLEYVASIANYSLVLSSGFTYGGSYGAKTRPVYAGFVEVTPFDNIATGYYNFTDSRRNRVIQNFKSLKPTRGNVFLPDIAPTDEVFSLYSEKWGSGRGQLGILFPTFFPHPLFFMNNARYPDAYGFSGYRPWVTCPYPWIAC